MEKWLEIEEFCSVTRLDRDSVESLLEKGEIDSKEEDGVIYIQTEEQVFHPMEVIGQAQGALQTTISGDFIEKTIGTILGLHEKVLDAKDETLEALKSENQFLKEALYSMQELYDEDRKVIDTLTEELKSSADEIEFLKRKYKLMWNKAVENYNKEEK